MMNNIKVYVVATSRPDVDGRNSTDNRYVYAENAIEAAIKANGIELYNRSSKDMGGYSVTKVKVAEITDMTYEQKLQYIDVFATDSVKNTESKKWEKQVTVNLVNPNNIG